MVTTEGSICPECSTNGKTNHIIPVYYKTREAIYTCEDKMCTYFSTDSEGNLVKFDKETNKTSFILDKTPKYDNADDDINSFLNSLANNYEKKDTDTFICPNSNAVPVQVPTSQSYEGNFSCENQSLINARNESSTDTFKVEGFFDVDSLLNFDDLL